MTIPGVGGSSSFIPPSQEQKPSPPRGHVRRTSVKEVFPLPEEEKKAEFSPSTRFEEALDQVDRSLKQSDPESAYYYAQRALQLISESNFESPWLKKIEALRKLAQASRALGQYQQALGCYKEAWEITDSQGKKLYDPLLAFEYFEECLNQAAHFLEQSKEQEGKQKSESLNSAYCSAERALQLISESNFESPWLKEIEALRKLAQASRALGHYKKALDCYQKAWDVTDSQGKKLYDPLLASEYAHFLFECAKDRQDGKVSPSSEYAAFLKDSILPNPLEICTKSLQHNPEALDPHSLRIQFRGRLATMDGYATERLYRDNISDCRALLKKKIKVKAKIQILRMKAAAHHSLHEYQEACAALEETCRLDPSPENIVKTFKEILDLLRKEEFSFEETLVLNHAWKILGKNPASALKLFEEFQQFKGPLLTPSEEIEILMGCLQAYERLDQKSPSPKYFEKISQSLHKAVQLLQSSKLNKEEQAGVYRTAALFYDSRIPDVAKAQDFFEKGFALCPSYDPLLFDYISFLIKRNNFEKALGICSERFKETVLGKYLKAKIESAQLSQIEDREKKEDKRKEIKEACAYVLVSLREEENAKKIEVYDILAKIHLGEENKRAAYRCMVQALQLDSSVQSYIDRRERLQNLYSTMEKEEADPGVPIRPNEHLIKIAKDLIEKDPEEAIRAFGYILDKLYSELTPLERFHVFMGRGEAFLVTGSKIEALSQFNQARSLLERSEEENKPLHLSNEERTHLHFCLARYYSKEGRKEKAAEEFLTAWKLCKSDSSLLFNYFNFLMHYNESSAAKDLLTQTSIEGPVVRFLQAKCSFASGEISRAQMVCERLCLEDFPFQVEAFRLAANACTEMELFEKAKNHAKTARHYAKPGDYLSLEKEYDKALKEHLEEVQLKELINRKFQKDYAPLPDKIAYFSAILNHYEKELTVHITCHINILLQLGHWKAQSRDFDGGIQACEDVLSMIEAENQHRIAPKVLSEIRKKVGDQKVLFKKQRFPAFSYQIPENLYLFVR